MPRSASAQPLSLLLTLTFLCGCTTIEVSNDYNRSQDFSVYQTFSFISDNPLIMSDVTALATNPNLQQRLMNASKQALVGKGLRFVERASDADFVVSFTLGARDKLRENNYPDAFRGGYYGGWSEPYHRAVDVRVYTEGTLAIDLFDSAHKGPVWHGWATRTLSLEDRKNSETLIAEVVTSILNDFPPPKR